MFSSNPGSPIGSAHLSINGRHNIAGIHKDINSVSEPMELGSDNMHVDDDKMDVDNNDVDINNQHMDIDYVTPMVAAKKIFCLTSTMPV